MPQYLALTYTADVYCSHPDQTAEMGSTAISARQPPRGAVPCSTATATTVRAVGKGGDVVNSDGPYAETKEALTGFDLLECADLDEALSGQRRFLRRGTARSRCVRSSRSVHEWPVPPRTCSMS